MIGLHLGPRCSCWCKCPYRARRPWQSGHCNVCSVGIHRPAPDAPDHGANGPRIVQARRIGGGAW